MEQIVPKWSGACYAIMLMAHISNIDTHKSIYYEYSHSIAQYGIIFLV